MVKISKQDVDIFLRNVCEDDDLKKYILNLYEMYYHEDMGDEKLANMVEQKILPIAQKKSLNFTVGELFNGIAKRVGFDEKELENVGGGVSVKHVSLGLLGTFVLSLGVGAGVVSIDKAIDGKSNIEQSIEKTKKSSTLHKNKTSEDKLKRLEQFKVAHMDKY